MLSGEINERKSQVVILKWNPSISSNTMFHYLHDLYSTNIGYDAEFDWSVNDYRNIKKGDTFFMVKVGSYGQIGILMSGTITSDPQRGEDWSGKGRVTYYVTFTPDVMIDPDAFPILTSAQLQAAIPDFDWFKGSSGVILNDKQAEKLKVLWENFLYKNAELFSQAAKRYNGKEKIYNNK